MISKTIYQAEAYASDVMGTALKKPVLVASMFIIPLSKQAERLSSEQSSYLVMPVSHARVIK